MGPPGLHGPHVKMQLGLTAPTAETFTTLLMLGDLPAFPAGPQFMGFSAFRGHAAQIVPHRVHVLSAPESWAHQPSWVYCQHRYLPLPRAKTTLVTFFPKSWLHMSPPIAHIAL